MAGIEWIWGENKGLRIVLGSDHVIAYLRLIGRDIGIVGC